MLSSSIYFGWKVVPAYGGTLGPKCILAGHMDPYTERLAALALFWAYG